MWRRHDIAEILLELALSTNQLFFLWPHIFFFLISCIIIDWFISPHLLLIEWFMCYSYLYLLHPVIINYFILFTIFIFKCLHKPLSLSELLLYRVCPYLYNIFYFKVHNLIMLLSFFTLKLDQTIITLFPFFIEMLQYDWLWNGHMIIKEMFYIPVKLKPELARASMTTSDVNNQWHSNFQQQIIHSLSRVVVPATLHTPLSSLSTLILQDFCKI